MSKLPKEGEMYLLLEKGGEGWTEGKVTVNDSLGALGRTVGQLYSQEKVRFHLVSFSSATHYKPSLKVRLQFTESFTSSLFKPPK